MKIHSPKDTKFKLTLTHKELAILERALNFSDDHDLSINDRLYSTEEFETEEEYEKFESKMWNKINDSLTANDEA